jgi:preprotein translocase subunit SecE
MARKPGNGPQAMKARASKTAAVIAPASALASEPDRSRKKTSPTQFVQEVRAEARKITWTSRRETWITSVMVFIMVLITAAFFASVDGILHFGVAQFLKLVTLGT